MMVMVIVGDEDEDEVLEDNGWGQEEEEYNVTVVTGRRKLWSSTFPGG